MSRYLRVVVPGFQAAIALVVACANKFYGGTRFYEYYLGNAKELILNINLPVVACWILVFSPIKVLGRYFPSRSGISLNLAVILMTLLIAISIALFWHLVVVEVEKRLQGRSILRPLGKRRALAAAIGFCCLGILAGLYGFDIGAPLWHVRPVDAGIAALPPAIWAFIFIGIGIQDLVVCFQNTKLRGTEEFARKPNM